VETAGGPEDGGDGTLAPELGLVEAYDRYLKERGREEEGLLERFNQVLKEVELEALAPGA
ncbi:hypothetical protein ABTO76_19755, partial [Acinetobacter baumannii]